MLVGITGSFAAGKTFVLDYLSTKHFRTFSADRFVATLYEQKSFQQSILELFPQLEIVDKKEIAAIIYSDEMARKALQALIHPFVVNELVGLRKTYISEIIFAEIPLLFESNLSEYFDHIITVFCSEKSRLERAITRGNFSQIIYDKITQVQLPQNEKTNRADFIINSDCNLLELESQITQILGKLQ